MTHRPSRPARVTRFNLQQLARLHHDRVADTAATLKARAQAARLAGLDSVTLHLPLGDARLIADALTEWTHRNDRAEHDRAVTARKDRKR